MVGWDGAESGGKRSLRGGELGRKPSSCVDDQPSRSEPQGDLGATARVSDREARAIPNFVRSDCVKCRLLSVNYS